MNDEEKEMMFEKEGHDNDVDNIREETSKETRIDKAQKRWIGKKKMVGRLR